MAATDSPRRTDGWLTAADCRLDEFIELVETPTSLADYPHAVEVEQNVVIYDASMVAGLAGDDRRSVQAELVEVFLNGPGIAVFKRAFADHDVIDAASAVFWTIIDEQRASGTAAGDHFAKPGANDRIWNALEKLAVRDPRAFVDYYANDIIALVSTAWLGPGYQVTAQVNCVNPGGAAQSPHRDYHVGFMTVDRAMEYPAHVHGLSPVLTLQGAVAHCDMPVETGPTLYLPHSQKYAPGYLAWWQPEFKAYFESHYVQLPLAKGDVVFFNPALFHAAGENRTTDVRRLGNLLQVGSAFGRSIETVDRETIVNAIYPALAAAAPRLPVWAVANVVAAGAEGYAFPTDLDRDQPVGGLTPPSMNDLVADALRNGSSPEELAVELRDLAIRRRTFFG